MSSAKVSRHASNTLPQKPSSYNRTVDQWLGYRQPGAQIRGLHTPVFSPKEDKVLPWCWLGLGPDSDARVHACSSLSCNCPVQTLACPHPKPRILYLGSE